MNTLHLPSSTVLCSTLSTSPLTFLRKQRNLLSLFLLFSVIFFCSFSFGQERKINKAEEYFGVQRYMDAHSIYHELIQKDKLDAGSYPDIYRHGADAAIKTKNYSDAKYALEYLSGTDQYTFDDAYRYIQLMMYMNNEYDARAMYAHRVITESIDPRKSILEDYFDTTFLEDLKLD